MPELDHNSNSTKSKNFENREKRQQKMLATNGIKRPEFPAELILPIFLMTPAILNNTFQLV